MESDNLNLRHIRAFYEVGRGGSITAATRRVFLSQSAITQAIANLEEQYGVDLFVRKNTGMVLTEPGEFLFVRARRALDSLRTGARRAQRGSERTKPSNLAHFEQSVTSAQLRSLVAIAQLKNFSMAARSIGVSQPSLYRSARDLERIAGLALFNSNSRGVELTPSAVTFARFVRLAFAELNQGRDEISAWRGQDTSQIAIGTIPLSRNYVLPQAIIELTRQRPNVRVCVIDGSYGDLLLDLREGKIDIIIGALRDPVPIDDVVQSLLFRDELSVVARSGHPLTRRPSISLNDIAAYPWVISRPDAPIRLRFESIFRDATVERPKQLIETNSLVMIRDLLLETDRLALVSAHQVEREVTAGAIATLKVDGLSRDYIIRSVGTTVRRGWHPTGTQSLFLDLLRQAADRMALAAGE